MRRLLPEILHNPVSLIGVVIAVFNTGFIIFLSVVEALSERPRPYADLIIVLVLPGLVLFGIVLIIAGVIRERRKQRLLAPEEFRLLVVDFNNSRHRMIVLAALTAFLLLSLLYAFAGYKTYEYTESDIFCELVCHTIHKTEALSYSYSPHAQVGCSTCHVGPGFKFFVLYKVKGTRQLFDILTNRYHRPIPTPVADLRPSQDTCETCHGPIFQVNQRIKSRSTYLSDKTNTKWPLILMLRMGRAEVPAGVPPMMHWHYSTTADIVYAAADPKRMVIPWIRVKRLDGKERIYRSTGDIVSEAEAAKLEKRHMDCIDCHNRAGHPFQPPGVIMNALLDAGRFNSALPELKGVGVRALETGYESDEEAMRGINETVAEFYRSKYPSLAFSQRDAIERAIGEIQDAYTRNYDPHMKVNWKNFPDNRGHKYSMGCFRCHDGRHQSDDGTILSKDCNLCHSLIERIAEGPVNRERGLFRVMKYPHPVDIGDSYRTMNCSDCHGPG